MPKDPMILLSYVNTHLRDENISFQELCARECVQVEDVRNKLALIDYHYDREQNKFI